VRAVIRAERHWFIELPQRLLTIIDGWQTLQVSQDRWAFFKLAGMNKNNVIPATLNLLGYSRCQRAQAQQVKQAHQLIQASKWGRKKWSWLKIKNFVPSHPGPNVGKVVIGAGQRVNFKVMMSR
jgi:hypothetical protein